MSRVLSRVLGLVQLLLRATTPIDRWVMVSTFSAIVWMGFTLHLAPGSRVLVHRDNRHVATFPLAENRIFQVTGALGPVEIEIRDLRARLIESHSLRGIGTRTGWIANAGEMAVCVPCGILLQIEDLSSPETTRLDAVAR